ncbi:DNA-processing protein DprA [Xanthovirga aplysinae]|uniref:DNA-processing protein DprA n=1 Tax=Xanthovirga aplysinae TaxID=2529853 RepID=UPI0012BB69B9|nr:DNA-processing protein DprA [Xanthovirga aplysinae]MTI32027.1 DNA-protecting protein DprA [Xanthovirga aplysinae]
MHTEKLYQVGLYLTPGLGDILIKKLISFCGSAEAVFKSPRKLAGKALGIGDKIINELKRSNTLHKAEKIINQAEREKVKILFYTEKEYPSKLKQIFDAPSLLFYKGNDHLNNRKIISVVGSRKATDYGKEITQQLIKDLAKYDPLIVSGLAYGIDICAHRSALENNLNTLGIMASGIDIIYPKIHTKTTLQMLQQGGILTENPFGTLPDSHLFPARNRIIAGISDLTIIVEAAIKGGAIITAHLAFDYDREVFAVPGDIKREYSKGCNTLIKDDIAHLCTEAKDIEKVMNWTSESTKDTKSPEPIDLRQYSEEEQKIISAFAKKSSELHIDEISFLSQLNINKVASKLLLLEFKGVVKAMPGKTFALNFN